MTTAEYDDAMARARAALAVLKRAAAELSTPGHDSGADGAVLQHLRDDLLQHGPPATRRQDAPSVAQPTRR
ncbi:hypothetical protein ACJEIK_21040 [Mycobacterium sp. SMC-16]|uniref:Uncharacterized protein n=1 Tax=Mycolicibacterium mucogenicum TaxID=56689 RepID=A0A1A0MVQ6_MYCMU|nr:hypothetical protein [Mycolicibacterium mucogenicum]MCX8554247.1 hypothetical protein [Mycolicibacterium mucogenicum]OBA89136.1 hypothetical protein A5642_15440 [Mycolicibacterium mucogenicum]